jgi:hypothetical protein
MHFKSLSDIFYLYAVDDVLYKQAFLFILLLFHIDYNLDKEYYSYNEFKDIMIHYIINEYPLTKSDLQDILSYFYTDNIYNYFDNKYKSNTFHAFTILNLIPNIAKDSK